MAEITLRAYLQEIDDLVEHEQLDEAIAHCRHVLQIYPKHLETYRLLGKSYLEAKRYGDAADLFQRVLSAIPDDFVAHIGMSIVREDEGNLDAAIWHMERAFETNPANPAIQQELRRLIGRRDGLEPHKVRLTRGALARMYAHGELYPQAIAELRSALQEDTDRPDLQTLLAEMYWRTEQRAEAAEVCTRLLEKLPYCRDALRIIAAALHAGGQVDDAAVYHRRLASLDPYAAFLDTAVGDSKSVEAGAVKVEKLVWHPGQPLPVGEAGRPQWNTTPAAATSSSAGQAIPSWLSGLDGAPAPVQAPAPVEAEPETGPIVHPFAGAKPPENTEVPDWMQQAGWAQSTGQAAEAPVSFSEEEMERLDKGQALPPAGEADLQPADIPDWLQKIAPSPGPKYPQEPSTRPSTSGPADLPDWLGEFAGDQATSPQEPALPVSSTASAIPAAAPSPTPASNELPAGLFDREDSAGSQPRPSPSDQVPSWLETPADGATETIVTWLGRKDTGPEVATPTAEAPAAPVPAPSLPEDEVPSWVGRMKSSGSSQPAAPSIGEGEGLPSWLSGVAEAASQEDSFTPADMEAIRPPAPALPGAEFEEEHAAAMPKGEAPDWLKAIASSDAEPQIPLDEVTAPTPKAEEPPAPDWMTGVPSPESGLRGFAKNEATPSWLRGTDVPAGLGGLAPSSSEEEEPEWLRGIEEPEAGPPAPPDWMRGIAEAAAAASPGSRKPADSPTPDQKVETGEPVMASDISAEETVISIRRESPAEETALTPAEAAAVEPPDWLREFASPDEPAAPGDELAAADVPSWLRSLGQSSGVSGEPELPAGVEEPSIAEFQGALDWLQESADEVAPDPTQRPVSSAPAPSPIGPPDLGIAEPVSDDEVFRWLEDLASRQAEEEPSQPGREGTDAPSAPPAEASAPPTPSALEPSLSWLDNLGEAEDVSADSSPSIVDSDDLDLTGSAADDEWLRDMATSPSAPLPTDLWEKLENEETIVSRGSDAVRPETSHAEIPQVPEPARPAADETVPGSPRSGLAGPRRPPEKSGRPPQTTPLTEGEVVEWLRQTASGGKPASGAEASTGLPEADAIPLQPDQAAGLAVQLIQAGRAALSSGDVPAALQAYAPVIERGLLLNSVIEDLRKAVELRPEATAIWQALGDAYKKANMLPEAIKAFSRAMKEEDGLEVARQALAQGDFALAVVQYGGLIKKKRNLESVIGDLRGALDHEPRRPPLWQALGDAYMKANRLPEAIDAYRRGMESV